MTKVIFKIYLFSLQSLYGNCYDVSVLRTKNKDFPGGLVVKGPPTDTEDVG